MTYVKEEDALRDRALARGWISQSQFDSGESLSTLISPDQVKLLEAEQFGPTQLVNEKMMNKLVEGGFLQGADILEPVREKFGRYEIIQRVGEGGTGQVYLVRDPKIDREVAIKILHRESMSNADRFHQEMEILASLKHPGIVTIYDAGVEEGQPYYAMEYVGDQSLQDLRCSLSEAVEIVAAIAEACHAAHEKGVIHRDLKPANILMGDRPVVADFGIAKRQNAELTETGTVLGTPYYMSPEQALGKSVAATTDVYSLGVILYELITGFRPFDGPSVAEISRKIVEVEPPAPRKRNQDIAPDLEVITQKAMAKEPDRRYPSARALAEDLRAFKEGRPIEARRTSFPRRVLLAAKRNPRASIGYAGALLSAVISLVIGIILGMEPGEDLEQKRLREEAQRIIADEREAIQAWRINLYLPPEKISHVPLKASVEKVKVALERKDLSPEIRSQGFLAMARSHAFMGNMQEALRDLDLSIGAKDSGDARLERVFIRWESMCRKKFLEGNFRWDQRGPIMIDLGKAMGLKFSAPWKGEFTRILFEVAESPFRSKAQKAVSSLELLGKNSESPSEEVSKYIGDMYLFMEMPDEAIRSYKEAIQDRRSYVQAYNALGIAYWMKKKAGRKEAVQHALRATEINPNYLDSYLLFSWLCHDGLRWYYARNLAEEDNTEYRNLLGKAEILFREAPDRLQIRIARGTANLMNGFFHIMAGLDPEAVIAEAMGSYSQMESFEGWFGMGRSHLLLAYARKETSGENLSQANRFLNLARRAKRDDPEVLSWVGFCHYQKEDFQGALEIWEETSRLDSSYRDRLKYYQKNAGKKR